MATRVEKIIERARDILADESGSRWSDPKMLRFLDEAYEFCSMDKGMLRGEVTIPVTGDIDVVSLADEVYMPTRVTYNGTKVNIVSYESLDDQKHLSSNPKTWETLTANSPCAFISDKKNVRQLRPYPIIRDPEVTQEYQSELGITESIDGIYPDSVYGIVSDISIEEVQEAHFVSPYGLINTINSSDSIKVYYKKKVKKISAITDELELEDVYFDAALKYYIVALALSTDIDSMNNRMSDKYFDMSDGFMQKVSDQVAENNTDSDYNVEYVGFV